MLCGAAKVIRGSQSARQIDKQRLYILAANTIFIFVLIHTLYRMMRGGRKRALVLAAWQHDVILADGRHLGGYGDNDFCLFQRHSLSTQTQKPRHSKLVNPQRGLSFITKTRHLITWPPTDTSPLSK